MKYEDIHKAVQTLKDAGASSEPPTTLFIAEAALIEAGWSAEDISKLPYAGEHVRILRADENIL